MANKQIYQLTETLSVSPDDWLAIDLDSSNLTRKARVGNVFSVSEGSSYSGGTANGIMFNDGNTFATSEGLKYDSTTTTLSVGGDGVGEGKLSLKRTTGGGTTIGDLYVNASHIFIRENQGSGGLLQTYDNSYALHWRRGSSGNDVRVQINPSDTSLADATFQVNVRADTIGQIINLSNGQTEDAFQINSYGNTGGDLFKVEDDGKTFVNGSSFSGISRTFNVGGAIGIGTGSYQLAWSPNWTGGVSGIGTTSIHSFGIATAGVLGLVQDTSQNILIYNGDTYFGEPATGNTLRISNTGGLTWDRSTGDFGGASIQSTNSNELNLHARSNIHFTSDRLYIKNRSNAIFFYMDYVSATPYAYYYNINLGLGETNPQAKFHTTLSTDQVGNRLDLSNGQTADAFQINSYGNTGGDLVRISNSGGAEFNDLTTVYQSGNQTRGVRVGYNPQYGPSVEGFGIGSLTFLIDSGRAFYSTGTGTFFNNIFWVSMNSPKFTLHDKTSGNEYVRFQNDLGVFKLQIYDGAYTDKLVVSKSGALETTLNDNEVGFTQNLSNGQTADAFQINSYGNTGGDLFKIDQYGILQSRGQSGAGFGAASFKSEYSQVAYISTDNSSVWFGRDADFGNDGILVAPNRCGFKVDGTERLRSYNNYTEVVDNLRISGMPTSPTGLSAGDLWNDSGTVKIV